MDGTPMEVVSTLCDRFDGARVVFARYSGQWFVTLQSDECVSSYDGRWIEGRGDTPELALNDLIENLVGGVTLYEYQESFDRALLDEAARRNQEIGLVVGRVWRWKSDGTSWLILAVTESRIEFAQVDARGVNEEHAWWRTPAEFVAGWEPKPVNARQSRR